MYNSGRAQKIWTGKVLAQFIKLNSDKKNNQGPSQPWFGKRNVINIPLKTVRTSSLKTLINAYLESTLLIPN